MNWRPNFIQIILIVAIFLSGMITILSIPITRTLTLFSYSGRAGLFFLGVFFIYTGYKDQRKKPSERSPFSAYQQPLIGSGVVIILFVLLLSIMSIFRFLR
jgi:hypothetical protein